jgi:hypothetical protein
MVIAASIYLRFYIEIGVNTFLPTRTPPKIPSDSNSNPQPWEICYQNAVWEGML